MKFKATFLHMAATEIKAMIPPYYFEDIKRRDPSPLFKAFVVGQEGKAEATWVGVGKVVKTWFADAIGKLTRKIYPGLKLFYNHAETNDQEGRTEIGEVAGTRSKTVDNKYSAIIAAYIYPEFKNLPLDVASVEVAVNVNDVEGNVHAVDVEDITGIALGNSAVNRPGFPGATLLGELQAFADRSQNQSNKGGENMPTLSEIKEFVKSEGIEPSEVFGRDQLIDDPVIKGFVKAEVKEATTGEYAHRKRTDEKFDVEKKKWDDEKKKFEDQIKGLKTEGAKAKATDLFSSKAKERKLDEKQTKFIESKQTAFEPQDLENLDKEIDKFLDGTLEEYKKVAEILGIEQKKSADLTPGSEPGESGAENVDLLPA